MSNLLEAALTIVGLVGGYMLAAVVVVAVTPKQERLPDRLAAAAIELTLLFILCVAAFVATEYWIDAKFDRDEDVWGWLSAWHAAAENMLSEVWQIWVAALYFKHRPWPGSPESEG